MEVAFNYLIVILAGFVAGMINTVAGSGSVVTLAALSFMQVPANIANATNRIGVLVQSFVGFTTYSKHTEVPVKGNVGMLLTIVAGAIVGTLIAVEIDEHLLKRIIGILMIGMLFLVLTNPKQWLRQSSTDEPLLPVYVRMPLFFLVGIYGGFIQAGVGILLLSTMILGSGFHMARANGYKLLIVLLYTIPTLLMFIYADQVIWLYGLLLAVGQSVGAYISASWASKYPQAPVWIRRLLIVIILLSIPHFLGFF